ISDEGARRGSEDGLADADGQHIVADDRINRTDEIGVERGLIEDVRADPVASGNAPGPLVVGLRVAHEQRKERRLTDLPEVDEPNGERECGNGAEKPRFLHELLRNAIADKMNRMDLARLRFLGLSIWVLGSGFLVQGSGSGFQEPRTGTQNLEPRTQNSEPRTQNSELGRVTFNRDVAPVVFKHCATCHHPGGAGPFSVLAHASAPAPARQIAEGAGRRYRPPRETAPRSRPVVRGDAP